MTGTARVLRRGIALFACAAACLATCLCAGASANHNLKEHLTIGPAGGNGLPDAFFDGSSQDGTSAFFDTTESLVSSDTDSSYDVYERSGGVTTLISTGPSGGNGSNDAFFWSNSADGNHVFFDTDERLVLADMDNSIDLYDRTGGTTTLVSTGPSGGNGVSDVTFDGASRDGSHVFFETNEGLVGGDTDGQTDIYERSGGVTSLVTTGPTAGGGGGDTPIFGGNSEDGTHVFFETDEGLVGTDTDGQADVYERSSGVTTLASTGSGGNGPSPASFEGNSANGDRVFFSTVDSLSGADTDTQPDVYERSGGTTSLVSIGPDGGNGAIGAFYDANSADGTHVFFHTTESLVAASDTDTSRDIYDRSGGTTTLISTGPAGGNGAFDASFPPNGATPDGTHVWFETSESLVSADMDTRNDVYERSGGTTSLISTGASGGNGAFDAIFWGASADGSRAFFTTSEPLEPMTDTDARTDVYERLSRVITTQISFGPTGGNGAVAAAYDGNSVDGRRVFFSTRESLMSSDTDAARDVYDAVVTTYVRPKGATPVRLPLLPAYTSCTAPNRTHALPLGAGSCSPPAQTSGELTVGTSDANGAAANSVGSVRYDVAAGNPFTSAEADVNLELNITDVRRKSDLSDYTGELQMVATIRMTDQLNGTSGSEAGTGDFDFRASVPCATTGSNTIGSTCNLVTTFDTLMPGAVVEARHSNWELGKVNVFDGGPDGVVSTTPNTLFATQGIFVP